MKYKYKYLILISLLVYMLSPYMFFPVNVAMANTDENALNIPAQLLADYFGYDLFWDDDGQAVLKARPKIVAPNLENAPPHDGIDISFVEQTLLDRINADRRAAGLGGVQWDETAAAASRQFAVEMARNDFISHWSLSGKKPQHRYTEAGGNYGTTENVCYSRQYGYKLSQELVLDNVLKIQDAMMAQKPPSDGHRSNILDPHHTHVGIGVAYALQPDGAVTVTFTQEFTNHYAELKKIPGVLQPGESLVVNGSMLSPDVKLYSIVLLWEAAPQPMSFEELEATSSYSSPSMDAMVSYALEGFPNAHFPKRAATGNHLAMDKGGNFSATLQAGDKQGLNYLQVWLQDKHGNKFIGNEFVIEVAKGAA